MKTKKQNILDLVMYSVFLIFFIYWFIKDDMPSTYLWILIIVYGYRQEFCVREYSQIRFFNLGGGV